MPDIQDPADRGAALAANRNVKMARSAHAYVRGNTAKFYDWLSGVTATCPDGPPVWICGDCHVGNLGPVADAGGRVEIQIRDLDQTVIGNPAHDLIRMGLSLASAARGSDLPGVTTVHMLEQMVEGYESAFAGEEVDEADHPDTVRLVLQEALGRSWKHLARERIGDAKPTIPLGKRFWPLSGEERDAVDALFEHDDVRRLVTGLRGRDAGDEVRVLDAAYWVKGCSSLGLLRHAVIARVGGKGGELCLVDIKEAVAAVAPRAAKAAMPRDNAERVVEGARHLAPNLGRPHAGRPPAGPRGVHARAAPAGPEAGGECLDARGGDGCRPLPRRRRRPRPCPADGPAHPPPLAGGAAPQPQQDAGRTGLAVGDHRAADGRARGGLFGPLPEIRPATGGLNPALVRPWQSANMR